MMDLWILFQTVPTALKGEGQVIGQTAAEIDDLGPAEAGSDQAHA